MLCSDKFGFMLLLDLGIDLRSLLKAWNQLKVTRFNQNLRTAFDSALPISLGS